MLDATEVYGYVCYFLMEFEKLKERYWNKQEHWEATTGGNLQN
jgi:hypothetical protein